MKSGSALTGTFDPETLGAEARQIDCYYKRKERDQNERSGNRSRSSNPGR
jgi:hypothetical protein